MNPRKMMELARMQQEFKKNHPKVHLPCYIAFFF